jgi:hypothetical protein
MKKLLGRGTLLVFSYLCVCYATYTSPAHASEQLEKVKAVFLFKFFDYVSWPDSDSTTDTLCTYGAHPFGDNLQYIAKMRHAKKTVVLPLSSLSDIHQCQILYIDKPSDQKALFQMDIQSTLVVSSNKSVINYGGMICMEEHSGRVQLSINLKAARKKKLKISSRLLEISNVIR